MNNQPIQLAHLILLQLLLASLVGCSHILDMKQMTALEVDCKTDDIEISDDRVSLNGEETWTAKCNGKTYSCNYLDDAGLGCFELEQ